MILWGLGGHVIKCGLAPILIDLMHRGYATAFAMNGAAAIHDFEIAIAGQTSEDVEAVLPDGRFGAAEETGREMNAALDGPQYGFGEALGRHLGKDRQSEFAAPVFCCEAYRHSTPVTVHVAIGTDTPHTHPAAEGEAIGRATHHDFRLLCSLVNELNDGGVYLNVGSAVAIARSFPESGLSSAQPGKSAGEFHHREFRFPPALPPPRKRSGTPPRQARAAEVTPSPAITK